MLSKKTVISGLEISPARMTVGNQILNLGHLKYDE
jgi:hypothetical protein